MSSPDQLPLCEVSPKIPLKMTQTGDLQPGVLDGSLLNASITVMGALAAYSSVEVILASRDQRDPLVKNLELMRAHERAVNHGSQVYVPGVLVIKSTLLSKPRQIDNELVLYREFDEFARDGDGPETRRLAIIDDTGEDSRTAKLDRRAQDVQYLISAASKYDRMGVLLLSQRQNPAMSPISKVISAQIKFSEAGQATVIKTPPVDSLDPEPKRAGVRTRADDLIEAAADELIDTGRKRGLI